VSDIANHFVKGRTGKVMKFDFGIEDDNEQVGADLGRAIVRELDLHSVSPLNENNTSRGS